MKKILTKCVMMILGIIILGGLTVLISKKILVNEDSFQYDFNSGYSYMEVSEQKIAYDHADLIVEIECLGNRKQFEKNIVMEAVITHVLKGEKQLKETLKIVEPMIGYNGYIPLKNGKKYIVLLKKNVNFDFEAYQFINSSGAIYVENPKFYEYDELMENNLKTVMQYDYLTTQKEEYYHLEKHLKDQEYLK